MRDEYWEFEGEHGQRRGEHQGQGHVGPASTKNKIDGRDGLVD